MIRYICLLPLFAIVSNISTYGQSKTSISGVITGGIYGALGDNCDTVILEIFDKHLTNFHSSYKPPRQLIQKVRLPKSSNTLKNGEFRFELTGIANPVYVTMRFAMGGIYDIENKPPAFFQLILVEPGDSISIKIGVVTPVYGLTSNKDRFFIRSFDVDKNQFSGRGSTKFTYQYNTQINNLFIAAAKVFPESKRKLQYEHGAKMNYLKSLKDSISEFCYQVLEADLIFDPKNKELTRNRYFSDSVLYISQFYARYIKDSLSKKKIQASAKIDFIKSRYSGLLRDKILTTMLWYNGLSGTPEQQESMYIKGLAVLQDSNYIKFIKNIQDNVRRGTMAYDFTLTGLSDEKISLSQFRGKTILMDFWYTGCGGCAGFYQSTLSKIEKTFENDTSFVFLPICIDLTKKSWKKSVESGIYTSPSKQKNVINLYTDGKGKDHPLILRYGVFAYPSPYIIDKYGRIFRSSGISIADPAALEQLLRDAAAL